MKTYFAKVRDRMFLTSKFQYIDFELKEPRVLEFQAGATTLCRPVQAGKQLNWRKRRFRTL